jgi:hypothetical protein
VECAERNTTGKNVKSCGRERYCLLTGAFFYVAAVVKPLDYLGSDFFPFLENFLLTVLVAS